MTPIELTKQMLGHLDLTQEQLGSVRDLVDMQADIIVRGFWERHTKYYEKLYKGEVSARSNDEI